MKTRATKKDLVEALFREVCRVGSLMSAIPILLSFIVLLAFSSGAMAQNVTTTNIVKKTPSGVDIPTTVVIIKGEYPGDNHIPAEVLPYTLSKDGDEGDAPEISNCPADQTVECFTDVGHQISALNYEIFCGPAAFVFIYEPPGTLLTGSCPGTEYTVTYVVWDQCGNSTSCEQLFTIDNVGPEITSCPAGGEISTADEAIANIDALEFTYSCPGDPLCAEIDIQVELIETYDICIGDIFTFTYTITDGCGRTDQCVQVYNILPPALQLVCAPDEIVECVSDISPSEDDVTVVNAIEGIPASLVLGTPTIGEGLPNCNGTTYTLLYTITDDCDRLATCVRTFTIQNDGPTIEAPADVTISCPLDAAANIDGVEVTVSCQIGYEVTASEPMLLEGNGFCDGSLWKIIYTVTDECGETASADQLINIANDGLMLPMAPEALNLECDEEVPAAAELSATDACGEAVMGEMMETVEAGDCANSFTITRTWTFDDGCNAPDVLTQTINVTDSEAPVWNFNCQIDFDYLTSEGVDCPADASFSFEVGDEFGINDGYMFAGQSIPSLEGCVTDNCTSAQDLIIRVASITTTGDDCSRSFVVTFEAEDECGNVAGGFSCSYSITDDVAPELLMPSNTSADITCQQVDPAQAVAFANGELSSADSLAFLQIVRPLFMANGLIPTGTQDDCNDSDWTEIDVNVSTENLEDCTVRAILECIFVAVDDCGNTSAPASTFLVINSVNDPMITAPDDVVLLCAADAAVDLAGVMASADCNLDFTVTSEGPTVVTGDGFCPGSVWEIVYTVTDECGRTATDSQMITIANDGPSITGPADVTIDCSDSTDPSFTGMATAMFPCGNGEVSYADMAIEGNCPQVLVRVWSATDGCSIVTFEQTITIQDTTAPELIMPEVTSADITCQQVDPELAMAYANGTLSQAEVQAFLQVVQPLFMANGLVPTGTQDDCNDSEWIETGVNVITEDLEDCTVRAILECIFVAVDDCGNTSAPASTFLVINSVNDPMITAPNDVTIECAADAAANIAGVMASADCNLDFTVTAEGPNLLMGDGLCDGSVWEFVYTVTDECGRTATDTQTVTISNEGPSITAPADVTIECAADAAPDTAGAMVMTSCDFTSVVTVEGPNLLEGDGFCDGSVWEFIYTVTDACGRTAMDSQMVTISNEGPSIAAPADVTIECAEDAAPNISGAMVMTSCELSSEVTVEGPNLLEGDGFCDGSVWEFVYTVTDACGRSAMDSQMVTINNDGPSINAPADAEVECVDMVVPDFDGADANAACNIGYEVSAGAPVLVEGNASCDGTVYTITYTVTDDCDRTAEATQTFTIVNPGLVIDLDAAPQDMFVACYEDIMPNPMAMYNAVATSCSTDVFIQITPPTKGCCQANCPGVEYVMTYTIIDACGNVEVYTQTFTLENEAPSITAPADMDVTCFEDIMVDLEGVEATAACDISISVSAGELTPVDGAENCPGDQYTVTYTATDGCGRTTTATQTFTIVNNGPSIMAPADVIIECAADAAPNLDGVNSSTFCGLDGDVTVEGPFLLEGDGFCDGSIWKFTYTVTDACDNSASADQMVTISNMGPSIVAPADVTVECAANAAPNPTAAIVTTTCDLGSEVSVEGPNLLNGDGFCDGSVWEFIYTVTDACGRTAMDSQMVTISNEGPSITAPADVTIECAADATPNPSAAAVTTSCDLGSEVSVEGPNLLEGDGLCDGSVWEFVYTVTDECGRTAMDSQMVTISNEGPSITAPADVTIACAADAAADIAGAMVMTSCELTSVVTAAGPNLLEGDGFCSGSVWEFVYTVTDACGRTAMDSQMVTISNNGPSITAPADVTIDCADSTDPSFTGMATAMFPCGEGDVSFEDMAITGTCPQLLVRVWSATDGCSTVTAEQTITIEDTTAPELLMPEVTSADITCQQVDPDQAVAFANGELSSADSLAFLQIVRPLFMANGLIPTGTEDDCNDSDWTEIDVAVTTEGLNDCTVRAILECIFVAVDDCGNTSAPASTFLVIKSVNDPMITAPADVVLECAADAAADIAGVMASADCNLDFTVAAEGPNLLMGDGLCDGSVWEFVYTVTDECGRTAMDSQMVTISNEGPSITAPADVVLECALDAAANTAGAVVMASCDFDFVVSASDLILLEGDGFCDGSLWKITYTVTDDCGRTAMDDQFITIENDGLVLPMAPATLNLECDQDVPSAEMLVAVDPCGQSIDAMFTEVVNQGDCPNSFSIVRTWTFADGCVEPTMFTQVINVSDSQAPVWNFACQIDFDYLTSEGVEGVDCPADAAFSFEVGDEFGVNDGYMFAGQSIPSLSGCVTDNCTSAQDLIIRVADITTSGDDCSRSFVVTFEAEDECGNVAGGFSCSYSITDDVAPELFMPAVTSADITCQQVDPDQAVAFANGTLGTADSLAFLQIVRPLFMANGLIPTGTEDDCNDSDWTEIDVAVTTEGFNDCTIRAILECIFVAVDDCGNTSAPASTFLVIKSVNDPMITAPADVVLECAADAAADIAGVMASADCNLDFTVAAEGPNLLMGDGLCDGSVWEFVYTVTDECGRTAMDSQMVTISNEGPSIISCGETTEVASFDDIMVSEDDVEFETACGVDAFVTISDPEIIDNECEGLFYVYTYMVMDQCGRTATCERTFIAPPAPGTCPEIICDNFSFFYANHTTGPSTIYGLDLVGGNAEMTEIITIDFQTHIAYNEEESLLYLVNQLGTFVDVYNVNTASIDPADRVMFNPSLGSGVTAAVYNSADGLLYIGRGANNKIRAIDLTDGTSTDIANAPVEGGDLALLNGNLYLATNQGGTALYLIEGGEATFAGNLSLSQINGMALTNDNLLLISGQGQTSFLKVNINGTEFGDFSAMLNGEPFTLGFGDLASGCNDGNLPDDVCENFQTYYTNYPANGQPNTLYSVTIEEGVATYTVVNNFSTADNHIAINNNGLIYSVRGSVIDIFNPITESYVQTNIPIVSVTGASLGGFPAAVMDSENTLWLGRSNNNTIYTIEFTGGQAVATPQFTNVTQVDGGDLVVTQDGDNNDVLWLANRSNNTLYNFVDGSTTTITLTEVNGVSVLPDGNLLFANGQSGANGGLYVYDVDAETFTQLTNVGGPAVFFNGDLAGGCVTGTPPTGGTVAPPLGQLIQRLERTVMLTFPNPTESESNVTFTLSETLRATVQLYDASGREIATLFSQVADANMEYRLSFDASPLPNGMYIYRLTTDNEVIVRKFMIAK